MIGLSVGKEILEALGAKASAVATVIGPKRPIIIKAISINCEGSLSSGVIPVDRPTVPKAENTSNRVCDKVKWVKNMIEMVEVTTKMNPSTTTATA